MRGDEKWVGCSEPENQGDADEEESLSLCDLPIHLISEQEEEKPLLSNGSSSNSEDFDFGQSLSGSKCTNSEMCAADDIFFAGQILPFRHSVSSENNGNSFTHCKSVGQRLDNSSSTTTRSISWAGSVDRSSSIGGFVSFSSRSSSINSLYSSSSSSAGGSQPRFLNRFHTFPSPKPQILKTPNGQIPGSTTVNNRAKKSSIWESLRLGLVRAPEIEFQDLKSRSSVSRNNSSGSSCKTEKQGRSKTVPPETGTKSKRSKGRLLSGCDCRVEAVALNKESTVVMNRKSTKKHSEEWKRVMMGRKEKKEKRDKGKEERSRQSHRTVEWINELSSRSTHG